MPFEAAESINYIKILDRTFLAKKLSPNVTEIESVSNFDEIRYIGFSRVLKSKIASKFWYEQFLSKITEI